MEQLTIKELAPYLPFDLKISFDYYNTYGSHINKIETLKPKHFVKGYVNCLAGNSKPILRPLSDFTKEINEDNQVFIPIEQLEIEGVKVAINSAGITLHIDHDYSFCYLMDIHDNITSQLLSWHFDIFNLIPRNLAIDINTIK